MRHEEQAYIDLLHEAFYHGTEKEDRTGVGSRSLFWKALTFDLSQGFPLFTTRQIGFRIAFEEMLFFLRGDTNTKKLEEKRISIWKGNTTREFLDARGLTWLPEGDMGKGYGWQMRRFGENSSRDGFDQLQYLIENIKQNPTDRRHMMSYWHPEQVLEEAALPPCHYSVVCQVLGEKLNMGFTMRSSDLYHGLPTNIAGYGFFLMLLAKLTGYRPGILGWIGADCHLYKTQYGVVEQQVKRAPLPFPQLKFKKDFTTLDEALMLQYEDVEIVGYQHCGKLEKVEMAV